MNCKFALILILGLGLAGCGSPAKQAPPPVNPLPNIAGTWTGTINLQGSTPNLVLVLTEDSSGNLSGTVSSTSGCNFDMPVRGAIYANSTFSVQNSDFSLLLAGTLANNNVDASGSITLGSGAGCGPANGAPFALGKQ